MSQYEAALGIVTIELHSDPFHLMQDCHDQTDSDRRRLSLC